jgi:hypothetical protein
MTVTSSDGTTASYVINDVVVNPATHLAVVCVAGFCHVFHDGGVPGSQPTQPQPRLAPDTRNSS